MTDRLEKLRESLPENTLFLVTDDLNIRYLCGVDYTDGFLLIDKEKAYLFADSRYIEVAKRDAFDGFQTVLLDARRTEVISRYLRGRTLAIEEKRVNAAEFEVYKKSFSEVVFSHGAVEKLRNVKSEAEKECIVKAQRIAERVFEETLDIISTDITEAELALEMEYRMRKYGADGIAFDTIAASGSSSSMPHAVPRKTKLEKGFLTLDFGAKYNGYCSDMTRTVCIGKPDDEMKKVYGTVLKAQIAALEFICAGRKCSDADKAARNLIAEAGYGSCFGHSLGHGVGLYIHENIALSPRCEGVLETGNVVTVEPGIYIEGKFGVRIEDMVYVTEKGCENLTHSNKELIIL